MGKVERYWEAEEPTRIRGDSWRRKGSVVGQISPDAESTEGPAEQLNNPRGRTRERETAGSRLRGCSKPWHLFPNSGRAITPFATHSSCSSPQAQKRKSWIQPTWLSPIQPRGGHQSWQSSRVLLREDTCNEPKTL